MTVLQSADSQLFRKAMSCFPTGVAVATILHPQAGPVGVTINSLVSVSLDPLLVLFCLGKQGKTCGYFLDVRKNKGHFLINVLASDQREESGHFTVLRSWEGVSYTQEQDSPPQIEGCAAYIYGEFDEVMNGGDHAVFLGRVTKVAFDLTKAPLAFHHSQYKAIE